MKQPVKLTWRFVFCLPFLPYECSSKLFPCWVPSENYLDLFLGYIWKVYFGTNRKSWTIPGSCSCSTLLEYLTIFYPWCLWRLPNFFEILTEIFHKVSLFSCPLVLVSTRFCRRCWQSLCLWRSTWWRIKMIKPRETRPNTTDFCFLLNI